MTYQKSSLIRWATRLGILIIVVLPLALAGLLYQQFRQAEASDQLVRRTIQVLDEIERLRDNVMDAESLQRLFLLTREQGPSEEFRQLLSVIPIFAPRVAELVTHDPGQGPRVKAMETTLEQRLALLDANAREADQLDPAVLKRRLMQGYALSRQLEKELRALASAEEALLVNQREQRRASNARFQVYSAVGLAGGMLVLSGVGLLLFRENRDRQAYEVRLADARDAALDAVKTTSAFVASVSHEIRTPMNGVLGTTDLLLRDAGLGPKQREGLEIIRTSGRTLLEIINDILDLSKLQAGEMSFVKELFSPAEVIESVITLFAQPAAAKKLELTSHLPPDLPEQVIGDPLRLRQVLSNLVSNAVKFTERGGVSVHVVRRREMESDGQICLRFDVSDTGPGIAKEAQSRLFQPFSQVDTRLSRRHGGTGLGLAVSRELVHRMNGAMGVESSAGKGATFWFTTVFAAANETSRVRSLSSRSLVVVEQRPMTAEALRVHASAWKLQPLIYSREGDVPLINPLTEEAVLDTGALIIGSTKRQDWLDLVKRLRSREWLKGTPIFVMTDQEELSEAQLQEAGITGVLHYPFRPSELYNRLAGNEETLAEVLPRPAEVSALRPATVIVADDNPVNQRVLRNQLEYLGLTVVVCSDGAQAVARVQEGAGELVLMDVQMPEMDGLEATRTIRRWEKARGKAAPIPIIAVTAHVMSGDAEECLQAGMDGYVPKPVELHRLQQVLMRWLGAAASSGGESIRRSDAAAAVPVALASLDEDQLRSCLTGEPEMDADLVAMAVQQIRDMQERLQVALREEADAAWRQAAHRGRGSAATMGFIRVAQLFQRAEFEATSLEARARVLTELREAVEQLAGALRSRQFSIPDTVIPG